MLSTCRVQGRRYHLPRLHSDRPECIASLPLPSVDRPSRRMPMKRRLETVRPPTQTESDWIEGASRRPSKADGKQQQIKYTLQVLTQTKRKCIIHINGTHIQNSE